MSSQVALKQLFELRVVLEVDSYAHLTDEDPGTPDPDAEGEE